MRRSGLYQCTQCKWYLIKTGKQWRGAFWNTTNSRLIDGSIGKVELDEYPDCIRHLRRVK